MSSLPAPARRLVLLVASIATLLGGATGCETFGGDASDAWSALAPPTAPEAARMAFDMNDPDQRRRGVVLLSNAYFGGEEAYVNMFRDYAQNDLDPIVRAVATRALARHGEPEDAPIVAANLEYPNLQVRWEAAKGLQRLHNEEVVSAMLNTLRDDEDEQDVRTAIARGLGQYPVDRVFQGLVAALEARELSVNMAARESLITLTGRDFGLVQAPWLRWYEAVGEADDDPFADRQDFLFPTYQRKLTVGEWLAFWSRPQWEQPALPAGLKSLDERSTYEDGDKDGDKVEDGDRDTDEAS